MKQVLSQEQKAQTKEFFKQIYGDPMKGGGVYLYDAGFGNTALKSSVYSMTAQALRDIAATGAAYASANIFKANRNGYCRRTDNFLWRFNHITIDIDYIGDFAHSYPTLEEDLEARIRWHAESYGIPMPNYIVFTGSGGCHLYYVFESLPNGSEKRMVKGIQATKMKLIAKWVEAESNFDPHGLGFKVDTNATDPTRVFRVPGSIHENTGRVCYMKSTGTPQYIYKNFCVVLEDKPWNGDYAIKNANRDIERSRNGFGKKSPIKAPLVNKDMTAAWLGTKRLNELFHLADQGWGFINCREKTAHLAWIWLRDAGFAMPECEMQLRRLNELFYAPLSIRELLYTAKGNGKNYRYSNQTIRSLLGLDGSEGFFIGHRSREFKDRAGKARKHKRLIAGLVLLGKKIREIAKELKLSISLVKRRRIEIKKSEGFTHWATAQI